MTQDAQALKAFEAAIGYRSFSFDPVVWEDLPLAPPRAQIYSGLDDSKENSLSHR